MVPWMCRAPASTAARVLATAQPVSLWACMPSGTPIEPMSVTISPTQFGSMPPLVSQRTTVRAPASAATWTTLRVYAGSYR